jgi:hypothetical protein
MDLTSCFSCRNTGLDSCRCGLRFTRNPHSRRFARESPQFRPRDLYHNSLNHSTSQRRGPRFANPLEEQPRVVHARRSEDAVDYFEGFFRNEFSDFEVSAFIEESRPVFNHHYQAPLHSNLTRSSAVNGRERRRAEQEAMLGWMLGIWMQQAEEVPRRQTATLQDRMEHVTTSRPTKAQLKNACTICLTDFQSTSVVSKLPCQHAFHQDCLTPWLEKSDSCPVCREPVMR